MPLNIKNLAVERLAAEVSELTDETKTEAIRKALEERRARLHAVTARPRSEKDLFAYFEQAVWPRIPKPLLGKKISKRKREEILGYGPHGV